MLYARSPATKRGWATALAQLDEFTRSLGNTRQQFVDKWDVNASAWAAHLAGRESRPKRQRLSAESTSTMLAYATAAVPRHWGFQVPDHTPLLDDTLTAIKRRTISTTGAPPQRKDAIGAPELRRALRGTVYADVASAVRAGKDIPALSAAQINSVTVAAAAALALAFAGRPALVSAPTTKGPGPLRSQIELESRRVRLLPGPHKGDPLVTTWRGPSPWVDRQPADDVCPVLATQIRDALFPDHPAMFPRISRCGRVGYTTTKHVRDFGKHMSKPGHTASFRAGHATAAFEGGSAPHTIKAFGMWKSDAWTTYTRVRPATAAKHVQAVYRGQ